MEPAQPQTDLLPLAQRVFYSLIVPLLGLLVFFVLLSNLWNGFPWTGLAIDFFIAIVLRGALGLIFVPFLLWAAVRSAAAPWRHWWSAVLGGAAATLAAYLLGVFVIVLLFAIR